MKTQITIALVTLSLLTAIVPPAQAFDLGLGSNGPGFPTDFNDNSGPSFPHNDSPTNVGGSPIKKGQPLIDTGSAMIDGHGIDVSAPVVPFAGPDGKAIPMAPAGMLAAVCEVAGTPSEFPDDIRVTNVGERTIPAGALIAWRTASPDAAGKARLASPLAPGASAQLRNAIPGGAEPDTDCLIRGIIA